MESQEFRDEHYDFVDALIEFIRRLPDLPDWYRTPVDLLEACRIELMMQLRPPVRDWMSWRRLIGLQPSYVELFASPDARSLIESDRRQMDLPFDIRLRSSSDQASQPPSRQTGAVRLAAHRFLDRLESRWFPRRRFPAADSNRIRVLFLDQYANSTQILIPVWQRLSDNAKYQCLYIAGREKVQRELAGRGIPSVNLRRCEPYVGGGDLVAPKWSELVGRFFDRLESRHGFATPPSVRASFCAAAGLLSEVKLTALRLKCAFERFRPNVFFVSSGAHSPARMGELLCREHRCVGLHLQHGLYKGDKETRNLLSETICLWGDFHRRQMERNPCRGKLLVVGSPKHDLLRCKYATMPQSARPLVAFYSSRKASWIIGSEDFERHLQAVCTAARLMPAVEFVIKLHPSEQRDVVERLTADSTRPANVRIAHADDAYELLQRCHVAATVSSTIGYEALLFQRPLLILNLTGRPDELPLSESCSAVRVTRSEDLAPAFKRLLATTYEANDDDDDFWLNDGRSLDRILDWAHERLGTLSAERT